MTHTGLQTTVTPARSRQQSAAFGTAQPWVMHSTGSPSQPTHTGALETAQMPAASGKDPCSAQQSPRPVVGSPVLELSMSPLVLVGSTATHMSSGTPGTRSEHSQPARGKRMGRTMMKRETFMFAKLRTPDAWRNPERMQSRANPKRGLQAALAAWALAEALVVLLHVAAVEFGRRGAPRP